MAPTGHPPGPGETLDFWKPPGGQGQKQPPSTGAEGLVDRMGFPGLVEFRRFPNQRHIQIC